MNAILLFLKSIFSAGGLSSKRFCGTIGWFVVIGIDIYCTIQQIPSPTLSTELMVVSASLLGLGLLDPRSK